MRHLKTGELDQFSGELVENHGSFRAGHFKGMCQSEFANLFQTSVGLEGEFSALVLYLCSAVLTVYSSFGFLSLETFQPHFPKVEIYLVAR